MWGVDLRVLIAAASLVTGVSGCASPPQGFDSPDPSALLNAITDAAGTRDQTAVPHLIEALDSDDPAVRLASIRALERITGQTLGYDHAAPPWRRAARVDEWQRWYAARPALPAAPTAPPAPVASREGGTR